jgi:hypothetical protein
MHLSVDAGTLINTALRSAWPEGGYSCQHEALGVRSGAECSWDTLLRIRDGVVAQASQHAGVILLTGTDTMDEMAFALSLLLHRFLAGVCPRAAAAPCWQRPDKRKRIPPPAAMRGTRSSRCLRGRQPAACATPRVQAKTKPWWSRAPCGQLMPSPATALPTWQMP